MLVKLRYATPDKARKISIDVPSMSPAYDGLARKAEIVADDYSVTETDSCAESLIVRIPQSQCHRKLLAGSLCRRKVQETEISTSVERDSVLLISNNRSRLCN
jgi:hypothetical protein